MKNMLEAEYFIQASVVLHLDFYLACSLPGTWVNGTNWCSEGDYMHKGGFRLHRSHASVSQGAETPPDRYSVDFTVIFAVFFSSELQGVLDFHLSHRQDRINVSLREGEASIFH